jgi:hypothetical protein
LNNSWANSNIIKDSASDASNILISLADFLKGYFLYEKFHNLIIVCNDRLLRVFCPMRLSLLCIALFMFMVTSCEKDPGKGGTSSITGKVYVLDYNSTFTHLNAEYYGPDEDVYIIYGNATVYDNTFKTSYDGSYRFDHLRKGNYKLFCYSKDSTGQSPSGVIPMIREVEITSNHQEVEVEDIVIVK